MWKGKGVREGLCQHFIHTMINLGSSCFFLELIHNTSYLLITLKYYSLFFVCPFRAHVAQSQLVFLSTVLLPLRFARMNSSWNSQILVRKKKSSAELVLNADFSGPAQIYRINTGICILPSSPLVTPHAQDPKSGGLQNICCKTWC